VLDRIADAVEAGATRILDVGTGTATLSIAAIQRWPDVRVVGIDASRGMAEAARAEADKALGPKDRRRYDVRVAFAHELPFDAGAFDAAVSSFVLQLVPSRGAVVRDVKRVLARGGTFAHVTWCVGGRAFQPDIEFDAALEALGFDERESEGRRGDYASVEAAAAELRRHGFRGVTAEGRELVHRFEPLEYEKFLEEFDEEDLFSSLSRRERDGLRRDLRQRLHALPADAFDLRLPVVTASGRRS
jgi:SAM-dependent methyltransferase